MRSKHTVETEHVELRRRHKSAKTTDEIERIHDDGMGSVTPRSLHFVYEFAIVSTGETVLRERWTSQVTHHSLHAFTVSAIDSDLSVTIKPADPGDGPRRMVVCGRGFVPQAELRAAFASAEQVDATNCGTIAESEHGL